jgi:hypothetical protein
MARSNAETRAASKQAADLTTVLESGGAVTYRVAVNHRDDDHDVAPVPFHYGPAYNDQYAQTAAEVMGVSPTDVDLREQAGKGLERAREEYPADQGYECWLEVVYPAGDGETHEVRRADKED